MFSLRARADSSLFNSRYRQALHSARVFQLASRYAISLNSGKDTAKRMLTHSVLERAVIHFAECRMR